MDKTSFLGSSLSFLGGFIVLLAVSVIGISAYKGQRMAEINLANKEQTAFEENLEEMNQQEIEGKIAQ